MFVFTAVTSFAPITYVLLPAFIAILCAPIYMLFITKVKTFGMITIMGVLIGILMVFTTGNSWIMFVFCSLLGLISDLITKAGGYTSKEDESDWILCIFHLACWFIFPNLAYERCLF